MTHKFDFVRPFALEVAKNLNLADDYLLNDPNGSIVKVGLAMEDLVNHIAVRQLLTDSSQDTHSFQDCIQLLRKICPKKVVQAMEYIRIRRNRANHEGWDNEYDARECLKQAHRICAWCIEYYYLGEATPYVAPENPPRPLARFDLVI